MLHLLKVHLLAGCLIEWALMDKQQATTMTVSVSLAYTET